MAFLKAKLILIIVAVVGLASVGGAVLAVYQGADTEQKMKDITGLVSNVQRLQNDAVNSQVIEAKKDERAKLKTEFDRTMSTVLSMQKDNVFYEEVDKDGTVRRQSRKLLIDGVLPDAKDAKRIQFRDAYKREFEKLAQKLHGRPGPTDKEIEQEARNASIGKTPTGEGPPADIWQPRSAPPADEPKKTIEKEMQLPDLLKQWPIYRAADTVARQLWVYVDDNAFGRHVLATKEDITPTLVDIWQAQMSLWIQQDIATALARCNEERAEQLRKQGVAEPYWVAQMPVKRLEGLSIASYLGKGGGSGPKTPDGFALSVNI